VLITGARGLLGAAIAREFSTGCELHALDHAALDITDDAAVERTLAAIRPDVVINCAAFNEVDAAEDNAGAALAVNAMGVRALARASESGGATLIHYSTDFVFDGETDRPYTEDDEPRPRSFYGSSKLLGEWFALALPRAFVLRVESLFGAAPPGRDARGSLNAIVARIRAGDEVPVFVDRTVSPSYTVDVARATRALIDTGARAGLYHCVNCESAN
jgi:dTDP-4-dehydrorhamnose reductase